MNTNPFRTGAPLEPGTEITNPAPGAIRAELVRAKVELMYAIAMHRKAWARMRAEAERRDEDALRLNALPTLESDPRWRKATGDVTWWRGEMQAQAAAIGALTEMLPREVLSGYAETTAFNDLPSRRFTPNR